MPECCKYTIEDLDKCQELLDPLLSVFTNARRLVTHGGDYRKALNEMETNLLTLKGRNLDVDAVLGAVNDAKEALERGDREAAESFIDEDVDFESLAHYNDYYAECVCQGGWVDFKRKLKTGLEHEDIVGHE